MERLTFRTELGVSIDKEEDCPTCSICCNCDIPPRKCKYISDALEKLADYEDLEEQGRLLKLPCKVGDDVYYILGIPNETPCTIDKCTFDLSDINKIGKTLFLTKSEAEAKLKELRGNNE
jgi:hypothetical protein|nr:MAG TPA: hypothetical protein [Bacteriophage sp.]